MSDDAADKKDDELLGQIDELKARMDRLMAGGTSTSNSALLTDAPRASSPVVEAEPAIEPPPPRSRVGDLIGSPDGNPIDAPSARSGVPFPSEPGVDEGTRPSDRPSEDRPPSAPPPNKPSPRDGSLITVDESRNEPRPRAESFDELGSVVEQEIAKDSSVPAASVRKGPDLASRFGPADEETDTPVENPQPDDEVEIIEAEEPVALEEADGEAVHVDAGGRRGIGAVVAIWVFTGVTSGTIAVLHFAGIL